jgi:hypothetical protein
MSSAAAARATDRKAPAAPSPRLTALYTALPDVPKPVVQLIDEYLRRLRPFELIRVLARAISPNLAVEPPRTCYIGVNICAFYSGAQLRRLLDEGVCYARDSDSVPVTRSEPSGLLWRLRDAVPNDSVTPLLKQLMAEDDGALCCVSLSNVLALWCVVLLAVPDGSSADEMLAYCRDQSFPPIKPLLESEPLWTLHLSGTV